MHETALLCPISWSLDLSLIEQYHFHTLAFSPSKLRLLVKSGKPLTLFHIWTNSFINLNPFYYTLRMCQLIKQKWACGCEKPIFRNTICRHSSSVDARLCKVMKIENKEYSEKCRTCRLMDALRRFMGLRQRSEGAEKETAATES
jgi:hypothetical protein